MFRCQTLLVADGRVRPAVPFNPAIAIENRERIASQDDNECEGEKHAAEDGGFLRVAFHKSADDEQRDEEGDETKNGGDGTISEYQAD